MDLSTLLQQMATTKALSNKIKAARNKFLITLSPAQKTMFVEVEDLYAAEELEHLTAAHSLLSR